MSDASNGIAGSGNAWPIEPPGVWLELRGAAARLPRPGLFLDRDGVVIRDRGFISSPDEVELLPGAAELIGLANRAAVPVAVVTNQSGIARKMFGWTEFAAVEREIARRLELAGARIDAVLACPFHPEFTARYGAAEAHWRKPAPGLVLAAARLLNIEIATSWLVGDRARDIEAARTAGLAGTVLLSGAAPRPPDGFQILTAASNSDAIAILQDAGLLDGRG